MGRLNGTPSASRAAGVPFRPAVGQGRIRVAVIGGSTPFLHDMLRALGEIDPAVVRFDVRLFGRDSAALSVMGKVAASVLGTHDHLVTRDVHRALDGVDCVLVQPRVGGWAARARDEDLAASAGAPADEGLGPGGLSAALRGVPVLRGLAADLRSRCPQALVIGFSNPLSTTVARLAEEGLHVVGVCELPLVTAEQVAVRIGVTPASLQWSFTGLNHRGFVHDLRLDGEDLLTVLIRGLRSGGPRDIGGIDVDLIEQIGAVPLKYHSMLTGLRVPPPGRGHLLKAVRDQALAQLRAQPGAPPAALAQRSMPWHRRAVVPLLLRLAGATPPASLVLDRLCADGLVRELVSCVSVGGVTPTEHTARGLPAGARCWIDIFEVHERALEGLLRDPTTDRLVRLLECDPATPEAAVMKLVRTLQPRVEALARRPIEPIWWSA